MLPYIVITLLLLDFSVCVYE